MNENLPGSETQSVEKAPGLTPQSPAGATLTPIADWPAVPGYRIDALLGEGGMGVVYRARDLRLPRTVAIKMIKPGVPLTPQRQARFLAEAAAVARLQHPHIVQIYELGEWTPPGGSCPLPWFALEFVSGGSLKEQLSQRSPSAAEAAHLVEVVARAVQHAHQSGILHRDLKPDNILLAPWVEGSSGSTPYGFPKVADFGLVRLAESESHTPTGQMMGTPFYMAPEQMGDSKELGPTCDVYALGGILYRLLTGRVPFEGRSLPDTLVQVRFQPPVPPRRVNRNVPPELEAICLKCLAKKPADRYPTAGKLADALRAWREGTPQAGPRPPSWPARLALPAGVLLVGLLALLLTWGWWTPAPDPKTPPEQAGASWKGYIDLTVTEPGNPRRQLVRLADPVARPVRVGDEVRVEVALNRPGYCYVLWIDSLGKVLPVYPWLEGEWGKSRPQAPRSRLSLPEASADAVWKIEPGPSGMETLVLLVRESALPDGDDLAARLGELGKQPSADAGEVAWFENGTLVHEKDRAPRLKGTDQSSNPILRTQRRVQDRLADLFGYTRAVTFANQGNQ